MTHVQLVKTPLWSFQSRELDIVSERPRTILGWDMGTKQVRRLVLSKRTYDFEQIQR